MTILRYIFGTPSAQGQKSFPATEQDEDIVYPVHTFDDGGRLEVLITTRTMLFNDVLDKDKVHNALAELLEIGDWRKAGGRLRQKTKVGI